MTKKDNNTAKRFSIGVKIYLFVIFTVFVAAFGAAMLSHYINAAQIDRYFKRLTLNSAENFASLVDVDFYARLKEIAASDEYQAIREQAEEEENDQLIEDYFKEKGIWEEYEENRAFLCNYLEHMDDIKYLYIVEVGEKGSQYDMYLMDDYDNPLSETGYYEEREAELIDLDPSIPWEPTISNGDWGWLCSSFVPVYGADGKVVCSVGCDVGMDDIMTERHRNFAYIIGGALVVMLIALIFAIIFVTRVIIKPLDKLTTEVRKFSPAENVSYSEANVVDINFKWNDEINEIYDAIRSMQINIIDYLTNLSKMQKDNENYATSLKKAESDIKAKEKQIGQISKEAYKDALTLVGNKSAYIKAADELNSELDSGIEFAIVMVDLNDLKKTNDLHGHRAGDSYIKGCCHIICNIYKHSPVFRIGGDEFVVILKNDDYKNRHELLEKARAEFAESHARTDVDPWERYSASLGMAERSFDDSTVEFVFKRADKAMYAEKEEFKKKYGSYR